MFLFMQLMTAKHISCVYNRSWQLWEHVCHSDCMRISYHTSHLKSL